MTYNSASDGTEIKLSELALAIARMEQQQAAMFAVIHTNATTTTIYPSTADTTAATVSNVSVAPKTAGKQMSIKQMIDTMLTSENKVVAATLHSAHFDNNNFDSNSDKKYDNYSNVTNSGTMSTDIDASYDNSSDNNSVDNDVGIGPTLDITAYNRFESTLAKLQVHASDIVRVDDQAIGRGGFAKVYKVMLKGNQLCAAKVSVNCYY
jgi:ABC-type sugar transport system ATPase subunit